MPYRTPLEAGHRDAIGGMWDELGDLQLQFLTARGLAPHHTFLDVGCGSLRAGVKLIPFLEPGNYTGIDQEQSLLDAGRDIELGIDRFNEFRPTLVAMNDFGFAALGRTFDYAIAQSVFSHLEFNLIARCVVQIARVLNPGGTFYCTYFRNPLGVTHVDPIPRHGATFQTFYDRDPFHYDVNLMRWLADKAGLEFEEIGNWNHPREQEMLAFRKPGA